MTKTVIDSLLARMKDISLDKQVSQQQNNRFFSRMRKQQGRLLTRKQYENKGNAKLKTQ